jgi:hypothetical protein
MAPLRNCAVRLSDSVRSGRLLRRTQAFHNAQPSPPFNDGPAMKPGRNDPCPCGSGKKYKHCCLIAATVASPHDLLWRRLRRELDGFPTRMLNFMANTYGVEAMGEAWHEFMAFDEDETEVDSDSPHMPVFGPWLFHQWRPDPQETVVTDAALHEVVPTQLYLARKGRQLDPAFRQYLQSCVDRCFSFYEVTQVDPGRSMDLRDVFTGETHTVREQSATEILKPGQITYALLAQVEDLTMLEASAPAIIGPAFKIELIALRERMESQGAPLSQASLRDWDIELREVYLDIVYRLLYPEMPELRTTDGEVVALQKLVFDIESAEEALRALKSLDFESTDDAPLEEVERDASGKLIRAAITWKKPGNAVHQDWSNTILGNIEITAGRMTAEVNSNERAEAFRAIVAERLGERARYRLSEGQSLDGPGVKARRTGSGDMANEALMNAPEVQALIQEQLARHYERWVEEPVPALGGLAPLEAVKDPVGREKVEALLRDIEQTSERMQPGPGPEILRRLRERLGM